MNKIIIITGLLFCFIFQGIAQPVNQQPLLSVIGSTDGNNIKLRWVVSEYEDWQTGNNHGYQIERYISHVNGVEQNGTTIQQSKVVLETALLPLSESQWAGPAANNKFAQVARGALYEEDETINLSASPTLADAVNLESSKGARHLFGLFAAEQNFNVAKGMALGYEDFNLDPKNTYIYRVVINNTTPTIDGTVKISPSEIPNLPLPLEVSGRGFDKMISIKWKQKGLEGIYSTYDVERSTDGTNFETANELPFLFSSDSEEDTDFAFFNDSLDNNETTYHYRVRGRTPFGTLGPPSQIIKEKGRPSRLELSLVFDKENNVTEEKVNLTWNNFDSSLENEIIQFSIFRSTSSAKSFEQINEDKIPSSARNFTDQDPIPTAYYRLEAEDKNGYFYQSTAQLIQLPDSEPPAIPQSLAGNFITSHQVQLQWTPNTESDLKGYRLFVANNRNSSYTQITSQAVVDEKYVYDIDPQFMVDSIFFKIISTDQRENYSDRSPALALARPDKIAPSDPVLFKTIPTPMGIEVGWEFSTSNDVDRHELQRKPQNAPGWKTVVSIRYNEEDNFQTNLTPNSPAATHFIDSSLLELRTYDYRLLAFDEQNNASSSKVLTVRPYDSGKRGEIQNLRLEIDCIVVGQVPQQNAYDIMDKLLREYENSETIDLELLYKLRLLDIITEQEYNALLDDQDNPEIIYNFLVQRKMEVWKDNIVAEINLQWDYSNTNQLKDFQVFRSTNSSGLMLYKTIKIEAFDTPSVYIFNDKDVKTGRRYFYQVMARHLNGGFSERSETIMAKVPKP